MDELGTQMDPRGHTRSSHRVSAPSILSSWRRSLRTVDPNVTLLSASADDPIQMLEMNPQAHLRSQDSSLGKDNANLTTPISITIDRALGTRNICIAALIVGMGIAITALSGGIRVVVGGRAPVPSFLLGTTSLIGTVEIPWPRLSFQTHYFRAHRAFGCPESVMILLSLFLNIAVTLILDCMNYIPSTTLRWSLWREGRQYFNSNLRLFNSAKHGPNRWYINILSGLSLVITYGAVSVITYDVNILGNSDADGNMTTKNVPGERYGLDFNGWGLLGVGIGLFMQACVSSWCLLRSGMVVTWSSDPLTNAKACAGSGILRPCLRSPTSFVNSLDEQLALGTNAAEPSRPALPDHRSSSLNTLAGLESRTPKQLLPYTPVSEENKLYTASSSLGGLTISKPQLRQASARSLIPHVRYIPRMLWVLFAMLSLWTVIVGSIAAHLGHTTRQWIQENAGSLDSLTFWQNYGQVYFQYFDPGRDRRDWLGLIIQIAVQSVITLGLHGVELLTNISRDEVSWRKASSTGAKPSSSSVKAAFTSWHALTLFAFKSLAQWVFGTAFSANLWIFMTLLPLLALTLLFLLLALFAEYLVRCKPKGSQPSTFGNIRLLVELVDEWDHRKLFWGDKGELPGSGGIRLAGTSGHRLAELRMNAEYVGLRSEPCTSGLAKSPRGWRFLKF
jgi:hypothetical protein